MNRGSSGAADYGDAVDGDLGGLRAASVHRILGTRDRGGIATRRYAAGQIQEIENVAVGERDVTDLRRIDVDADCGVLFIEDRHALAGHRYDLPDLTGRQHGVNARALIEFERQSEDLELLEALGFDADVVRA